MPNQVITGGTDATARVYNMRTGSCVNTFRTKSPVMNVAASHCGSFAVAATKFTTHIIDFKCDRSQELEYNHPEPGITVDSITVTKNGRQIVSGLSNGEISTFDLVNRKTMNKIKSKGDKVKQLTTSSRNNVIAVYYDKSVRIYDIKSGTKIGNLMHNEHINTVTTSSNGYYVATASQTGKVQLYWYKGRDRLFKFFDYHNGTPISAIAMSEDQIVSGDTQGNIVLFSIQANTYIRKMKMDLPITSIAFSTDYKHIVTSTFDAQATLWDIKTGEIVQKLNGHNPGSIITSLAVSDECLPELKSDECQLNENSNDSEIIQDIDFNDKPMVEKNDKMTGLFKKELREDTELSDYKLVNEENDRLIDSEYVQVFKNELKEDAELLDCMDKCNIGDIMPDIDGSILDDKQQEDIRPLIDQVFGPDNQKSVVDISDNLEDHHYIDIIMDKVNKFKREKLIEAVFNNDASRTITQNEEMRQKALIELGKMINHRFTKSK